MIKDGAYTYKDMIKDLSPRKNSPNKQEGPIDKKNLPLQPSEMEGTYVYEGTDMRERIIDLEDRAEFAMQDAENAEGEKKKQHLATAKKLQREADIMRKRMKNEKSAVKQTSQDDFKPAYPGADYSKEDIAKMTRKEKEMKIDGYDPALDPTQPEYKKRKQLKDPKAKKSPMKGYKSDAQRKAVHASKADGGKGNPNKMKESPNKQKKKNSSKNI